MKIDTRNAKHWWLLLLQAAWTALAILRRPFTSKPQRPVVIFYGHQFAGNLKALYVEWHAHYREKLDVYFLTLDPEQYQQLKAAGIQALACHRWRDMRELSCASAMVTDHGLHAMFPLVQLTDITFIDVWHGIPFKGFTPDDFRLQHRYDEVWVPSDRVKTLYCTRFGFDPGKVRTLGYARTDKIFRKETAGAGFRARFGIDRDKRVVVYAPTWNQKSHEPPPTPFGLDIDEFVTRVGAICSAYGGLLVSRCHLNSRVGQDDSGDVLHVPQKTYPDTEDILLETDILICDWSSVSFDFAPLNRPTLFLDVQPPFHNGLSLGREYRFGMIINDMPALERALADCLSDPGTYHDAHDHRQSSVVRELYAEGSTGKAAQLQLEHLGELVAGTVEN